MVGCPVIHVNGDYPEVRWVTLHPKIQLKAFKMLIHRPEEALDIWIFVGALTLEMKL